MAKISESAGRDLLKEKSSFCSIKPGK